MRRLALLLLLVPLALPAQSIMEVSPQQCVWREGDNPAWAAPTFTDSAWQPYTQWKVIIYLTNQVISPILKT
jgi:hypothetical protein